MYKIEKNITSGFELYPPDFNRDANDLKAYLQKTQIRLLP